MPKKKSIPLRMCIACREMKPKAEMTRIVKTAEGDISLDPTGKMAGRGAYICNGEECLKKLQTKKLLHKAFSTEVAAEVYQGAMEEQSGK